MFPGMHGWGGVPGTNEDYIKNSIESGQDPRFGSSTTVAQNLGVPLL